MDNPAKYFVRDKPGRYGIDGRDNGVEDGNNGGVALGFIPNVPGCRVAGQAVHSPAINAGATSDIMPYKGCSYSSSPMGYIYCFFLLDTIIGCLTICQLCEQKVIEFYW